MAAAKYLGVAPWELNARPLFWLLMAEAGMDAEDRAQKAQERRQARTQQHQR